MFKIENFMKKCFSGFPSNLINEICSKYEFTIYVLYIVCLGPIGSGSKRVNNTKKIYLLQLSYYNQQLQTVSPISMQYAGAEDVLYDLLWPESVSGKD